MNPNRWLQLGLSLAALAVTNCSVIHFQNGPVTGTAKVHEEWHHNFAFNFYEGSAPVDMSNRCPQKWSMVTTKDTFVTVVAGSVDEIVTGALLKGFGIDIWAPHMIEFVCKE